MSLFGSIIFGPIKSRRLGVSLGVNLLPSTGKVCSFDCIYCECGYNGENKGGKIPSKEEVFEAMESRLKKMSAENDPLDVITFAGNGEPTMHPDFPEIIDFTLRMRDKYYPQAKVSVLSNSTRIDRQPVFDALQKVDNNILKLDSAIPETVELLDAPNQSDFDLKKLIADLARFNGNVIIQTIFLRGEHCGKIIDNTTDKEVSAWIEALKVIKPKQVMLY